MLDIYIVILVVLFMLVALYQEWSTPSLIFLLAIVIFYFSGIITIGDILHGLSNESIILIFLLIIVSEVIKRTAVIGFVLNRLLRPNLSYRQFMTRMTTGVAFFSGWINNTPLVAFMMPYVYDWARKKGIAPSKVLLPLSYAALMGGTITLIGTSTNLVVNGLAIESGLKSLHLFDFIYVGIPVTVLGTLYLIFIGSKWLPDRENALSQFDEHSREYLIETIVPPMSGFTGKTIEEAGLRNLNDLFLVQILRNKEIIAPVTPKEVLHKNDCLFFAGNTDRIIELVQGTKDLILPYGTKMINQPQNHIVEAVIPDSSKLHNQTAKEYKFSVHFDAAIIGIQRNSEKLRGKLGEVKLKAGDLLLLVTGKNFPPDAEQDIQVVTRVKKIERMEGWKVTVFYVILLAAFTLSAVKILPLFIGLLCVIGFIAVTDMIKLTDIRRTLDFNLFFLLVLALALGKAITNSGLASYMADYIINFSGDSTLLVMISLYLITNIISMFVTNAAAVAVTFPIALAAATEMGVDNFKPFILVIAYAASAEFMTPFGYQTNLMVYGPGGYKFKDYIRVGFPLSLLYMVATIVILKLVFGY
ncbi:MAG: anion permease [Bacteroidales bacterium]|nr:anion permease [Bacteroidales bacterium]